MSNRDTQFAGFAKLLWKEIEDHPYVELGQLKDCDRELLYRVIARWAYDFAKHTMSHVSQGMSAENEGGPLYLEENMRCIPDMTELPKEEDGMSKKTLIYHKLHNSDIQKSYFVRNGEDISHPVHPDTIAFEIQRCLKEMAFNYSTGKITVTIEEEVAK